MTSHAALVARGWGKCCIVGARRARRSTSTRRRSHVGGTSFSEGDWITLNGTKGHVYAGKLADDGRRRENPRFQQFMAIVRRASAR